MKRGYVFYIFTFVFIFFFFTPCSIVSPVDERTLKMIIEENQRENRLIEYKDNVELLKIKLEDLARINRERSKYGAHPVEFDIFASRVANKHCKEMAERRYSSHWNEKGEKPYHRYAFAGGVNHVIENLYSATITGKRSESPDIIKALLEDANKTFMSEPIGADGHKKNIINPFHTHLGTGMAIAGGEFRYAQEFVDKYIEFDNFDSDIGSKKKIRISGKIIPDDVGIYSVIVYGETLSPKSVPELNAMGVYNDFSSYQPISLWPWDLTFDRKKKTFQFELDFNGKKQAYYYVQIKLKKGISSIPYRGGQANTAATFDGSGIVLNLGMPSLKGETELKKHSEERENPNSNYPLPEIITPSPQNTSRLTPALIMFSPSSQHNSGEITSYHGKKSFTVFLIPLVIFVAVISIMGILICKGLAYSKKLNKVKQEQETLNF